MRNVFVGMLLVSCAVPLAAAHGQTLYGNAYVQCQTGAHVVSVGGYDYETLGGRIDHLVLRRESVGVCEPDVFLDDSPLPFLPVDEGGYFSFHATVTLVPPRTDVAYRYRPFAVFTDGTRRQLNGCCDSDCRCYALTSCPTTPFLRGQVVLDYFTWPFRFRIAACGSGCWTEVYYPSLSQERLEELAGLPVSALLLQYVDLYGYRTYCGMPGDASYVLTRIALSPGGGCGAVPTLPTCWGTVKAMFR